MKGDRKIKKFSKERMLKRCMSDAYLKTMLCEEVYEILDNLDGQPTFTNCWARNVKGRPVLWCIGKDGKGYEVAECDCV